LSFKKLNAHISIKLEATLKNLNARNQKKGIKYTSRFIMGQAHITFDVLNFQTFAGKTQ
jgi:hypothetical protein